MHSIFHRTYFIIISHVFHKFIHPLHMSIEITCILIMWRVESAVPAKGSYIESKMNRVLIILVTRKPPKLYDSFEIRCRIKCTSNLLVVYGDAGGSGGIWRSPLGGQPAAGVRGGAARRHCVGLLGRACHALLARVLVNVQQSPAARTH